MKIDYFRYTLEDYKLLKDLIEDEYKDQAYNKPSILELIDEILNKQITPRSKKTPWVNFNTRKYMYKHPLNIIPLFLNHKKRLIRIIIRWRLKVGK